MNRTMMVNAQQVRFFAFKTDKTQEEGDLGKNLKDASKAINERLGKTQSKGVINTAKETLTDAKNYVSEKIPTMSNIPGAETVKSAVNAVKDKLPGKE